MMGSWGYDMMNRLVGFGILATLMWFVVLIDLILLGVWLWKQINKK